ncbi:MAG: nucleoside triphosphate pyrophosphohydrolase, partial [Clostridia bacterium]|nr:nucleoside triphosphate pyrophosphohydrolase [Clostridia bacterium]
KAAIAAGQTEHIEEELGDLLFSVVNVSRFVEQDAEQALTVSTDKFITRFEKVEALATARNLDMSAMSIDELDELWKEAKTLLK